MNKIDRFTIRSILKSFTPTQQSILTSFVESAAQRGWYIVLELNKKKVVLKYDGSREAEQGFCVVEWAAKEDIKETLLSEHLQKQKFAPGAIIPEQHLALSQDAPSDYLFAHLLLKSARNGKIYFEPFRSATDALLKASEIITNRGDIYRAAGCSKQGFFSDLAQTHLNYSEATISNYVQIFLLAGNKLGRDSLIIKNYGQRNDAICVLVAKDTEPTLAKYLESHDISCSTAEDCAKFLVSIINPNKAVKTYSTREQAQQALNTPKDIASGAKVNHLAATLIMRPK